MRKDQIAEALTALIASAFTHHQKIMQNPTTAEPPTPEESKTAYLNDVTIHRLTDATVFGVYEILSHNKPIQPDA